IVIHPAVRNAAIGVAAVVMLAGFGYVVTQSLEQPPPQRYTATALVKVPATKFDLYGDVSDSNGAYPPASARGEALTIKRELSDQEKVRDLDADGLDAAKKAQRQEAAGGTLATRRQHPRGQNRRAWRRGNQQRQKLQRQRSVLGHTIPGQRRRRRSGDGLFRPHD